MTTPDDSPRHFGAPSTGTVGLDDEVVLAPEDLSNPTKMSNPLDELRDVIVAQVEREDLVRAVLSRPGLSIRYSTVIDMEHVQRWRRSSHDKTMPDNFNVLKFSLLVLANTCKAIALRGTEPTGADGGPLTFVSPELAQWTGQKRALDVVRALYASDGHVISTSQEVLDAAGYGDESMEPDEDPTAGS